LGTPAAHAVQFAGQQIMVDLTSAAMRGWGGQHSTGCWMPEGLQHHQSFAAEDSQIVLIHIKG
jgi:hypothetical protein